MQKCALKKHIHRFRASCLILTRCGVTLHHFPFLGTFSSPLYLLPVVNNHSIRAQQDGLVD